MHVMSSIQTGELLFDYYFCGLLRFGPELEPDTPKFYIKAELHYADQPLVPGGMSRVTSSRDVYAQRIEWNETLTFGSVPISSLPLGSRVTLQLILRKKWYG
jgi:hypothetical protein